MKEKDKNCANTCQTGCGGCSVKQIWLGIAVIVIIMITAAIFGN
ncbi:MAG: hypothetical protein ABFC34_01325 [Methanobacterium sp.]